MKVGPRYFGNLYRAQTKPVSYPCKDAIWPATAEPVLVAAINHEFALPTPKPGAKKERRNNGLSLPTRFLVVSTYVPLIKVKLQVQQVATNQRSPAPQ